MDINFPLVLVVLVFVTGVVWLIDALFLAKGRKEGDTEPTIVEYSKSFFPVLAIVLVLRSFIAEPFKIPSGSMEPTLKNGDFILVNKFTYGLRLPVIRNKVVELNDPKRGDVMVFFPPHRKNYYIKRVVGVPGDVITMQGAHIYVNGVLQPQTVKAKLPVQRPTHIFASETLGGVEHDIRRQIVPGRLSQDRTYRVPEGQYFMMGDNRDDSSDSREWGFVPEENIVGKAFFVWMHWPSLTSLPSFGRSGSIQ